MALHRDCVHDHGGETAGNVYYAFSSTALPTHLTELGSLSSAAGPYGWATELLSRAAIPTVQVQLGCHHTQALHRVHRSAQTTLEQQGLSVCQESPCVLELIQ